MQDSTAVRTRLTQAARRLVDRTGLELSAADVAREAALPATALAQTYGDLDNLLCELLAQMYDETRELIAGLTHNMPTGRSRLKLALDAYLQAMFERRGLRALTLRLRFHPQGQAVIRQRVRGFRLMLQLELRSVGWRDGEAVARLATAAIIDIGLAEAEAGRPLPELRDTLLDYFDAEPA